MDRTKEERMNSCDTQGKREPAEESLERRTLHDFGYFGHFLHVYEGGRGGKQVSVPYSENSRRKRIGGLELDSQAFYPKAGQKKRQFDLERLFGHALKIKKCKKTVVYP